MSAVASRKLAAKPGPTEIFRARCEARAKLWQCGELSLHEAVDALQADAVASGLVREIGQDAVQQLISDAFIVVRGRP
jgi:hypothetical protein